MKRPAVLVILIAAALWLVGTWFLFGEPYREAPRVSPPRAPEENASCAILGGENL